VDFDSYLLELIRYIHSNPLEAEIINRLESYPWSSHKGYLSRSEKWDWLRKDYVLKIFSKSHHKALKRYKDFVHNKIPQEINHILGSRKWPSVIGNEGFLEWVNKIYFVQNRHVAVPESRALAPDLETIKEYDNAICEL